MLNLCRQPSVKFVLLACDRADYSKSGTGVTSRWRDPGIGGRGWPHAPSLCDRSFWYIHHSIRRGPKRCRIGFCIDWSTYYKWSVDQIGPPPKKNVAGNPMLRAYWTDPADSFIIRSAVVWRFRFLFVSIGLLQVDQIGSKSKVQFGTLVVDQSIQIKNGTVRPRRIEWWKNKPDRFNKLGAWGNL